MDTGVEVTPSPDGTYAVHAQPWEAGASQWVYLPWIVETTSGARIWSPTDRRWSLDRATWQSGAGVLLRLRKFPGAFEPPFLDVAVDCAARTASLGGVQCELAALELHLDLALAAAPEEGASPSRPAARVDTASVQIRASAAQVFRAFADPQAMATWLPPEGMTGEMRAFDFTAGGGYRMRLSYPAAAQGAGKTSADADEVAVRFVRIVPPACIEESVRFESDDPAYAGEMRITWLLAPDANGAGEGTATRVTVRCEQVPRGIDPADHVAALQSTLAQLAAFVEGGEGA